MYYYNNELPPQQGWICPKCGRVNAPWMPTCGCVSSQTRATFDTTSLTAEQTQPQCEDCKHFQIISIDDCSITFKCPFADERLKETDTACKKFEPKDEPQIQLTARCLNCNNAKACKEKHWEECVYEPKDEKTCETCRHWKYIAHEWQCEACKCQGYEPKDESQTEDADCDKCIWSVCNYNKAFAFEDEPQADCDGCQHYADKHTADACYECKRSYTDGYEPQAERSE